MSILALTDKKIFFSKNDPDDLRLGDVIASEPLFETVKNQVIIVGYPDDRGIENNGGRIGAKDGPSGIRRILYKLVAGAHHKGKISDIGDFSIHSNLDADQVLFEKTLNIINQNQNSILSFGGGHDWAFCDVSSFIQTETKNNRRPIVVNIDAHLDVRSDRKGINSGTPFYKILERYAGQFDFYQVGIQPHCNSKKHFDYVHSKPNVKVFKMYDVDTLGIVSIVEQIKLKHQSQPLFLSLDIDAITASEAPGCSQSWPGGMSYESVKTMLRELKSFPNWNHMGIYEVSPPLDLQNITQKAAALAAYEFISHKLGYHGF